MTTRTYTDENQHGVRLAFYSNLPGPNQTAWLVCLCGEEVSGQTSSLGRRWPRNGSAFGRGEAVMTTRHYSDERRWADTDPSMHFNGRTEQVPDWRDEYLELIKRNDEAGAHELRLRNDERYAEDCQQRAASVYPVKGSELRSLAEAQSERDAEAA